MGVDDADCQVERQRGICRERSTRNSFDSVDSGHWENK